MHLNTIQPATGARKIRKRVGRGIGSGLGKTCGRGHKGQKSRSGGYLKPWFEGGQMPIKKRLGKVGFRSRKAATRAEVRLDELGKLEASLIDIQALIEAGIVPKKTQRAKVIASGEINKSVSLKGVLVTPGARQAIEAAGGSIEE
ncbi:MAG: 50S ribosomal protein L15 [Pseudomonadota bacterium]